MKNFSHTPEQVQWALKNFNDETFAFLIIDEATDAGLIRRISHTQAEWTTAGAAWALEQESKNSY